MIIGMDLLTWKMFMIHCLHEKAVSEQYVYYDPTF